MATAHTSTVFSRPAPRVDMGFYHQLGRFVPALVGIILLECRSPLLQAEILIIRQDLLEHHYPECIWNEGPFSAREVAAWKSEGEAAGLPLLSQPIHQLVGFFALL